jgi:hypothetical protein
MSLIEVTIATLIFVSVMSAVMQFMVSSRHLSSLGAAEDQVNLAGKQVLQEISQDLAQSGWSFPNGGPLPGAFGADRNSRYFPYVVQQAAPDGSLAGGQGGRFRHTWHPADPDFYLNLGPPLPGRLADATTNFADTARAAYLSSFYARSQELIFVRLSNSAWQANPGEEEPGLGRFGTLADWAIPDNQAALGVLYPSAWEQDIDANGIVTYAERSAGLGMTYGVPIYGGRLQQIVGGTPTEPLWEVAPMWETIDAPIYDGTGAQELREYMYAVTPSPSGMGRLVRAHKVDNLAGLTAGSDLGQYISNNGAFAMVVDKVLSDDVVRVVFDTYRTTNDLDVNEIRVRLCLAKRQVSNPDVIIFNTVASVLSMRSRYSVTDRGNDRSILTNTRPGFDF